MTRRANLIGNLKPQSMRGDKPRTQSSVFAIRGGVSACLTAQYWKHPFKIKDDR